MAYFKEVDKNGETFCIGYADDIAPHQIEITKEEYEDFISIPQSIVKTEEEIENEQLWQTVTQLELDAMLTNQQLTDAELEIELLKMGGAA